jgi:hypothetical protein
MSFQGYESERGRQQQAIQFSQQEVDKTISNLQAQALPRLIEDLGVERGIELFKARTQELLAALQSISSLASLNQVAGQSQSTGENTSFGGIVPALLPKGLQGG